MKAKFLREKGERVKEKVVIAKILRNQQTLFEKQKEFEAIQSHAKREREWQEKIREVMDKK